ncbi:Arc family DNA-binding protein [Variovorax sp. HJSM1_2]|uniref:Arc family DNA-binding protein n=1 Tax=Variovorax sp. HJSM1_2 TaxID=3366263 RepID=UPI003BBE67A0
MKGLKKKVPLPATPVVIRLPKDVISALDKAAQNNCRSRSSEMRSRLERSLGNKV